MPPGLVYCESIGVTADKEAMDYFLSVMPVKDALVAPNWTTSTLEIIPGRGNETAAQTQMRLAREKEAILDGGKKRSKSPQRKTWQPHDFSDDKAGKRRAVGVKKAIPKNTLSFRLLIKTLCEVGVGDLEVMRFKEMLRPISFDNEDLGCALRSFFECMPAFVPQFKDEGEIPTLHLKVIKFLRDPSCETFFGLLLRYAYWNVVHPICRAVLKNGKLAHPEMFNAASDQIQSNIPSFQSRYNYSDDDSSTASCSVSSASASVAIEDGGYYLTNASLASETSMGSADKESLFVKLEICMNKLSKKMNFNYADMSIGQRAFVACCHFVCDEILKVKYNWFILEAMTASAKNKEVVDTKGRAEFITSQNLDYCRLHLQRAVHEALSDVLDPIRIYGTNLVRKEIVENMMPSGMTTKVRGQYHTTSATVRALMGSADSPEARRFMSRAEATSYVPLPGSIPPDINKLHIQRGTTFDEKLLSPELTWNGTVIGSKQFNDSSSSQSSKRPFQATIIKKNHHAEIPLSTTGKNALFNILKEKQKSKYTGTRMDKYSRVPDVKSRTALLDGKGDIMVGSPGRCSPHCRRIVAPVMNGAS